MEGKQGDSSIDLSHLTEEEQTSILQVVQRDLELRRRDEGRVRTLEQRETNPTHLRFLSGAWFSEARDKRHHNWMSGCDLVHATIRHRKTKSRDVPLNGLFNGEREDNNNTSPETEGSVKDHKEEENGGTQNLKPVPTPTAKDPMSQGLQHSNSSSSSKECETRSNGHLEEPEEDLIDNHNGDTDSLSSLTETDPSSLRTSSSTNSLHSGYVLSGSMMSLFSSGDFGVVEVRGRIQYSLAYDNQKEELQVKVYRCEDIAAARKKRSDPYVKTYLLPDKSNHSKKKTSVKKKTLNPVYDQTLRYKVRVGELRSRTLNLSVWHAEPLGRNVFLGEVEVALALWDWTCTQPLWQDLQPRVYLSPDSISSRGNIMFSIKFIPEGYEGGGLPLTGEVHIWLREAQGLLSNKGGAVDSFVRSISLGVLFMPEWDAIPQLCVTQLVTSMRRRCQAVVAVYGSSTCCYILPDASRQSSQKTRVVKRSISPTYNHTMVYDGFHTSDLREACAELTVWQREGLKTHILGGIRLSCGTGQSYGEAVSWMDSTEEEVAAWTSMIENPNHWIDATLPIRTNLARRSE